MIHEGIKKSDELKKGKINVIFDRFEISEKNRMKVSVFNLK